MILTLINTRIFKIEAKCPRPVSLRIIFPLRTVLFAQSFTFVYFTQIFRTFHACVNSKKKKKIKSPASVTREPYQRPVTSDRWPDLMQNPIKTLYVRQSDLYITGQCHLSFFFSTMKSMLVCGYALCVSHMRICQCVRVDIRFGRWPFQFVIYLFINVIFFLIFQFTWMNWARQHGKMIESAHADWRWMVAAAIISGINS